MKQSAVRTLGVAALGAAFAAAGAGAANAATPATDTVDHVTSALDGQAVAPTTEGVGKVLSAPGQVKDGVDAAAPVQQVQDGLDKSPALAPKAGAPQADSNPVSGLLGGLPLVGGLAGGGLGGGLPVGGGGLPLGG